MLFGRAMSKPQRDKYLPAFLADDRYHLAHASCLPETELGINYHFPVNAPAATITATPSGSDFILNGTCAAVVNAPIANAISSDWPKMPCCR